MGEQSLAAQVDVGVVVQNRQRLRQVPSKCVCALVQQVLGRLRRTGELGFHFVGPAEMARVNWEYLRHEGSTDVITFDHGSTARHLYGECFICVAEAVKHAGLFGTTWQEEMGRYIIHGLLHLAGYDDLEMGKRRRMKRLENALTRQWVTPEWLKQAEVR